MSVVDGHSPKIQRPDDFELQARATFEAYIKREYHPSMVARNDKDEYQFVMIQNQWIGWRHAANIYKAQSEASLALASLYATGNASFAKQMKEANP